MVEIMLVWKSHIILIVHIVEVMMTAQQADLLAGFLFGIGVGMVLGYYVLWEEQKLWNGYGTIPLLWMKLCGIYSYHSLWWYGCGCLFGHELYW